MEEKKYGVWAVRSAASMFGAAEAWCKADGVPMEFDSLNAARLYANHLNETAGSPNVHYYSKEMQPDLVAAPKAPVHFEMQPSPGNSLKTAELDMEAEGGNYNMIDGVINNLPPAKADLTDGQTYDEIRELAPETLPEEKPSVLERLKADIPHPEEHELAVTPPERER